MMESCKKNYFTQTINNTKSSAGIEATFKDQVLEKKFKKFDIKKQLENTTLYTIVILALNSTSLVFNLMANQTISISSILLLVGLVFDFVLAKINNSFKADYCNFQMIKFIRFFLVYLNCALVCIFYCGKVSNMTMCIRITYIFLLTMDCFYILFLDFNHLLLIIVLVLNSLFIATIQTIREVAYYELLPEILVNVLYYFATYILKKNEFFHVKNSFLMNEQKNEYFQDLVDSLNSLVININKDDVLFLNSSALSFFERKGKKLNRSVSITVSEDFKDNESLFNQKKETRSEKNKIVNNFFHSIMLINALNKSFPEGKSLKEINKILFDLSSIPIKRFEKIGIFSNSEKNSFFEIHVRKVKLHEEVLEILINDITDIKIAERDSIEAKHKNKVLAKIAHEFKTPLLTILSLIDKNMENEQSNRDYKPNFSNNLYYISNLSKYTLVLISDITQFALGFVDLKMNIEEIDIKEVLEFSFNILKTLIDCNEEKSKNIIPLIDIDNNITDLKIESDINRLKQILLNFISNSFKFTFSGFIKLRARLIKGDDDIEISVKDTGIGIKEEDQKLIFQENTQISLNQAYNRQGSGFGLAITKNLAEYMNCKVGFKSEYGKGSKFFIKVKCFSSAINKPKKMSLAIGRNFFPIQLTETDNLSARISDRRFDRIDFRESCEDQLILIKKEISLDKKFTSLATKEVNEIENEDNALKCNANESNESFVERNKIIVVDDHKIIRAATKNVLKEVLNSNESSSLYDVIECSDGIDLLYLISHDVKNRVKLILIDENMVYLNGSETVKIIRKLEMDNKIRYYPIVSITGIADEEGRKFLLGCGFDYVVPKPCSKSQIKKLLNIFNIALSN